MLEYKYGRNKEKQVGKYLIKKGWRVWIAKGSRGPWDLYAIKKSRKWCIQVKATRGMKTSTARLSPEAERRLKIAAARMKAIPVLALLAQNHAWFLSVRNKRELDPR